MKNDFESVVNGAYAIQHAEKIKEYCKSFKRCEDCVFFIGTCQLVNHPFDWDLKEVKYDGN